MPAQFTGFSTSAVFINRSSADREAAAELVRWWDEKGHRSVFVNSVAGGDDEWIDQFRATVADVPTRVLNDGWRVDWLDRDDPTRHVSQPVDTATIDSGR